MNISGFALLTDLYQLTMAYGYWKANMHEYESVFHLFFRKHPFKGGFTVACGLETVIDYLENFSFSQSDVEYLAGLKGNDGKALFEPAFLEYLASMEFSCDVMAVAEGSLVFPHAPLLRIQGPIIQCQILETALLNLMNFPTLIATKSARICLAAQGESVLEFGLRRAQGLNGALSASRAAYIGGCVATSNVLAGKLYDIPVKGTHAHSWVMSFPDEMAAFKHYARALPNNCVFLVDTYDTLKGVDNAIEIGLALREQGYEMQGIRLDSGDLAELSIQARKKLDQAGFKGASIVASNDLDEYRIQQLKKDQATINVWGVGTRLATAFDQPALGGVYKLSAIRKPGKEWQYKVKLSEQKIKISNPGMLQVRRFTDHAGNLLADLIWHEIGGIEGDRFTTFSGSEFEFGELLGNDILLPIFVKGKKTYHNPNIHQTRAFVQAQLEKFSSDYRRLQQPGVYPSGLEPGLVRLKEECIRNVRR